MLTTPEPHAPGRPLRRLDRKHRRQYESARRVPITPANILLKIREHGPLKFINKVAERLLPPRPRPQRTALT